MPWKESRALDEGKRFIEEWQKGEEDAPSAKTSPSKFATRRLKTPRSPCRPHP